MKHLGNCSEPAKYVFGRIYTHGIGANFSTPPPTKYTALCSEHANIGDLPYENEIFNLTQGGAGHVCGNNWDQTE